MIHYTGIESIIESIYLEESIEFKAGRSNIEVNPTGGMDYIVGKTVILSNLSYTEEFIENLVKNRNKVYSRVKGYSEKNVNVYPYIMRPNFLIMWNGETLNCPKEKSGNVTDFFLWLKEKNSCSINDLGNGRASLYFPKIYGIQSPLLKDEFGNVTGLGWALHQVGINLCPKFKDMDILKTKKLKK